jgi:hypothetical protein
VDRKLTTLTSYSYQYVELSIRYGRLESLEAYRVGPSKEVTHPVGAHGIPSRRHRRHFTVADDKILWDWMQPYEERGDPIAGNVCYQLLAGKVPNLPPEISRHFGVECLTRSVPSTYFSVVERPLFETAPWLSSPRLTTTDN